MTCTGKACEYIEWEFAPHTNPEGGQPPVPSSVPPPDTYAVSEVDIVDAPGQPDFAESDKENEWEALLDKMTKEMDEAILHECEDPDNCACVKAEDAPPIYDEIHKPRIEVLWRKAGSPPSDPIKRVRGRVQIRMIKFPGACFRGAFLETDRRPEKQARSPEEKSP